MSRFFSIIIPSWNRASLLKHALHKIACQTFHDYEVIVVIDNASIEYRCKVEQVLAEFEFSWQIILGNGRGPSSARNFGIKHANGSYCAFCDDDDSWVDKRHLEAAYEVLSKNEDLTLFFGNQVGYYGQKIQIPDWLPKITEQVNSMNLLVGDCFESSVKIAVDSGHFPHLNASIVSKSLALSIGGFWEEIRYCEDYDFFLRCADRANRIIYRNAIVSRHNIPDRKLKQNASSMVSKIQKELTYLSINNHIRATCDNLYVLNASEKVGGYAYKKLAEEFYREKKYQSAWLFAKQAIVIMPSFKWLGFIIWLFIKRYMLSLF